MPLFGSVKGNLQQCGAPRDGLAAERKVVSGCAQGYSTGNFGGTSVRELSRRFVLPLFIIFSCISPLSIPWQAAAADDEPLSNQQIKEFLLTAKVVKSQQSGKGVTHPWKLTLSNGTITHDASFQPIDEHKPKMDLGYGRTETNFVDSYKYNVAAYEIAELLGLDNMLPVYVERKWEGKTGSLSWWLPIKMDDAERFEKKIEPPDPDKWNKQMFRVGVFDELVYDTDPNLTNVLIGQDWSVYRVDFSRAFRTFKDLRGEKNLVEMRSPALRKTESPQGR